jgi:hypothetical protein
MPPHENYESKLFTLGPVGYAHINRLETVDGAIDFSPVIAKAQSLPGFTEISEPRQVMVGFAHNTVLSVADTVVDALKQGKIRHFFLSWRLRWRKTRSQLLHRICGTSPRRLHRFNPCLWKIPLFRQTIR